MQHVRIATYKQTAGTFEELSRMIQAPGGLADVFRATPGFVAYTSPTSATGRTAPSASGDRPRRRTRPRRIPRTWTAANIADLGHLVDDRTGRLGFVVGELGPVPA
jgi:hypothetical protein